MHGINNNHWEKENKNGAGDGIATECKFYLYLFKSRMYICMHICIYIQV